MPTRRPTSDDLAAYLAKDEKVLWSGAPPGGILFRASDLFLIPFTLVWAGFVIFWNAALWLSLAKALLGSAAVTTLMRFASTDAPPSSGDMIVAFAAVALFLSVGLIFLVFGYYVTIGRFISDARRRARTLYAVTNYRALIVESGRRRLKQVRGYELTLGGEISVAQGWRESGSITFGQPDAWFGTTQQQHLEAFVFERIPQVRDVMRVVETARRTSQ